MGKIYAIIPARSGSKSIKDKNIQILNGRPLMAYSIIAAKAVPEIDQVFVTTDSKMYAMIAMQYSAEVVMRPESISQDDSPDIEFIEHFLSKVQGEPEYLVHLRPPVPLRDPKYISQAINTIRVCSEATALRSVHQMPKTAYKHFEVEDGFLRCIFTKSTNIDSANIPQQNNFPITYDANGYVDVLKVSFILKNKLMHGDKVIAFQVPHITDIDEWEDFEIARYELGKDPSMYDILFDNVEE